MDSIVVMSALKGKISDSDMLVIKSKLDGMDQDRQSSVLALAQNLKSPVVGLILSIFLGVLGIDRFYKGDILIGILKNILIINVLIKVFSQNSPELAGLIAAAYGIFCVVDIFLVFFGIKKDNYQKLMIAM